MGWRGILRDESDSEFAAIEAAVQDELLAMLNLLDATGPQLGREHTVRVKARQREGAVLHSIERRLARCRSLRSAARNNRAGGS